MLSAKLIYLLGAFINVMMINIVKYIGLNGILSINEMIMMRAFFAVLILLPFNWKELKNMRNYDRKTNILIVGLGLVSVLDTFIWYQGLQTVPINNVIIMMLFLSPIITATMSRIILKERIQKDIVLNFVINISAVFLIYRFSIGHLTVGYLFLFIDFFIYAFMTILIKKLHKLPANFLVFIRLLTILPISAAVVRHIPILNTKVMIFIALVVFGYIIERTLVTYAFKIVPVIEIQPLRYFNIVFSSFLSYLILGEKLTKWQIIGSCIIIFGSIGVNLLFLKKHSIETRG
ncbi:MAG: DMT family transporter [Rickettsiales bacterium]|nr:DMT family transporter [Rickettsiales bacterium]